MNFVSAIVFLRHPLSNPSILDMVGDGPRGGLLELLVTKVLYVSNRTIQIVGDISSVFVLVHCSVTLPR